MVSQTADAEEIGKFSRLAQEWWDGEGPFGILHRMNPVRLQFIRSSAESHFDKDSHALEPFKGLDILDIGCGGGLVSEPLARLGGTVMGIDASGDAIEVAQAHQDLMGASLALSYQCAQPEDLLPARESSFDIITALEIIEHVADVELFLKSCSRLLKPGGLLILSTLNRTIASYIGAILAAEYVLRWVPQGTHQWNKFIRPEELRKALESVNLSFKELKGMEYCPFKKQWKFSNNLRINYIAAVERYHLMR